MIGAQGESLLDPITGTADRVLEEYVASKGDVWSSKDMLQIIQRKSVQPREEASPSPRFRSAGAWPVAREPSPAGFRLPGSAFSFELINAGA